MVTGCLPPHLLSQAFSCTLSPCLSAPCLLSGSVDEYSRAGGCRWDGARVLQQFYCHAGNPSTLGPPVKQEYISPHKDVFQLAEMDVHHQLQLIHRAPTMAKTCKIKFK